MLNEHCTTESSEAIDHLVDDSPSEQHVLCHRCTTELGSAVGIKAIYRNTAEALQELRRDLETETSDRQSDIDLLRDDVCSRLVEIQATQTADATELGFIKGDVDGHDDRLDELELESKILQRQVDSLLMQRFTRRCVAADILRTIAIAAFGFGIATFIGAGVSGSQQQKDELANTGALMTVIAVTATALGVAIDD